jgi:hypothetical protein
MPRLADAQGNVTFKCSAHLSSSGHDGRRHSDHRLPWRKTGPAPMKCLPAYSALMIAAGLTSSVVLAQTSPQTPLQPAPAAPRAVVELFTSQGCSSCPPADRLFTQMTRDPSVITLTLPVDYWDYLGWKDTLANPAFSQRQRHYAQLRGDGNVYTPQAVVNGVGHVVGSDKGKIDQQLAATSLPVALTLTESAAGLTLELAGSETGREMARTGKKGDVWLLPVTLSASVAIQRGENRGKTITYSQVARGIHLVGHWNGEASSITLSKEKIEALSGATGADGFVAILQISGKKQAKILGAARTRSLEAPAS